MSANTAQLQFRRPIPPEPIEIFEVPHPAVPPQRGEGAGEAHGEPRGEVEGLRILHISDLHIRRVIRGRESFRTLCAALEASPVDLVALTGDYMEAPGQERGAAEMLAILSRCWRARLGAFGIFGNHDTTRMAQLAAEIPVIEWIGGRVVDVPLGGANVGGLLPRLRLIGLTWPEDPLATLLRASAEGLWNAERPGVAADGSPVCNLALAHYPTAIIPAAEFGIPLVLAGHTHAGQVRISSRLAPHTSSDVPVDLASGMLRLRSTLCCVSRGVGDGVFEGLRFNCPRQVPLYVLRHGELPAIPRRGSAAAVTQVVSW